MQLGVVTLQLASGSQDARAGKPTRGALGSDASYVV